MRVVDACVGVFLVIIAVRVTAPPAGAQTGAADSLRAREIVQSIDELYRSESSYAELKMVVEHPHWTRTLELRVWTEGMDKTLIRITSPAKERDVGTLRVGDEMWNYLPKTNSIIKVPPSMMMSSWMGSDFKNDDLVSEFTFLEDYRFAIVERDSAMIAIRCTPKKDRPIVWNKVRLEVRRRDHLPIREVYYDEHDRVMRIMRFEDTQTFDGRRIPARLILEPQTKEDRRTVLEYQTVDFGPDIPPDTFTLRRLRNPEP